MEATVGRPPGADALTTAEGEPASMAVAVGATPTGIRVTHVHAPPLHRGNGYATSLVTRFGRQLLQSGRRFRMLDTDRAHPTSNGIDRRIGSRGTSNEAHLRFDA